MRPNLKCNARMNMLVILALCALANSTFAQPIMPATPDILWYGSNSQILGINTAMIGYGNPVGAHRSIIASAYYDATGTETVHVKDLSTGLSITPAASLGTITSVPDIVFGINITSPIIDYIVATAYVTTKNRIEIDFYKITDNGFSAPVVTSTAVYTISGYRPHTVHLDLVAEAQNLSPSGFPICDKFVITWDDFSVASSPNVYAAFGSLDAASAGTPQQINPSGIYGYAPDVAAVQRIVSGPALDDFGLITYVAAGGNGLYYSEWDVTGTAVSFITLDNGSTSTYIAKPRIDAYDDFNHNNPLSTSSVYKVAAEVGNLSGNSDVRTYDNYMYSLSTDYTSSSVIDITGVGYPFNPPPYNNYAPTVAFGVQLNFEVTHYTNYSNTPPADIIFMEPLPWNNPFAIGTSYFWASSGSGTPVFGYNVYASAAAAAVNDIQPLVNSVYTWATFDNTISPPFDVYYKAPPYSYSFKPGTTTLVNNVTAQNWKAYPNPTSNELVVRNATGAEAATGYAILDMAGRIILQGKLHEHENNVDVSELVPGTYILKVCKGDDNDGQVLFVKN